MIDLKTLFSQSSIPLSGQQETKLLRELLDDTVAYYSANPSKRSTTRNGTCYYRSDNGNCCAVGRFIHDEDYNPEIDKFDFENKTDVYSVWDMLPSYITKLPASFLSDLQDLHDIDQYWNETGLTEAGKLRVQNMIIEIHNSNDD